MYIFFKEKQMKWKQWRDVECWAQQIEDPSLIAFHSDIIWINPPINFLI